jgi:hypothetical protein
VKVGDFFETIFALKSVLRQTCKKKLEEMNTGDSMYISPYTPHSFTTRKNKEGRICNINCRMVEIKG